MLVVATRVLLPLALTVGVFILLRGHNTSGKTKALELLFPFCLDGDIRPQRLDPFASTACGT